MRLSGPWQSSSLWRAPHPIKNPIIDENGVKPASFDGLDALVSDAAPGRVLWVHGMCRHDDLWAQQRARTLAAALGATYTPAPAPLAGEATWTDDMEFTVPSKGRVDVTFFLWSRLVDKYRQRLAYDADVGATRATLNKELKLALTDSCLVDAIIYSGRNGDGIRVAMRKAVCRTLGGTTGATGPCDLSGHRRRVASPSSPRASAARSCSMPCAISGLRPSRIAGWKGRPEGRNQIRAGTPLGASLGHLHVANQLPLLDQASPLAPANMPYESSKPQRDRIARSAKSDDRRVFGSQ